MKRIHGMDQTFLGNVAFKRGATGLITGNVVYTPNVPEPTYGTDTIFVQSADAYVANIVQARLLHVVADDLTSVSGSFGTLASTTAGFGNVIATNLTAQAVSAPTATLGAVTMESLVSGTVTTGTLVADSLVVTNPQGALAVSDTIQFNADTSEGMVVDGDFFQFNGSMYGNGAGLTSFAERTNASLEERLRTFSNSPNRLYVSPTGSDANHGKSSAQPLASIRYAASLATKYTTIYVESGEYVEDNPIYIKPYVAIIGDSLRTCILRARYPTLDFFHMSNMTYLYGLRFVDLQSPGFCAAFPCSLVKTREKDGKLVSTSATLDVEADRRPLRMPIMYSPDGYYVEQLPPTLSFALSSSIPANRDATTAVTVSATPNSTQVIFAGCDALACFAVPNWIVLDGGLYRVASVNSASSATLMNEYSGAKLTGAPFFFGSNQWVNGTYTIAGTGSEASRRYTVSSPTYKPGNPPWQALDAGLGGYESVVEHMDFNGLVDCPLDVSITLELPFPKRYVAYQIDGTNLTKWKLQARETTAAPWTLLDSGNSSGNASSSSTGKLRTDTIRAYSYYRLVMLQNSDSGTFKVGRLQFFELELPRALVDGPVVNDTIVTGFDIVSGGSGYLSVPTVTIDNVFETEGFVAAQAIATVSNGAVTSVDLVRDVTSSVQSIGIVSGGAGYVTPPSVAITAVQGQGSGAAAFATIDKFGAVVGITITGKGTGYTLGNPLVSFVGTCTSPASATTDRTGRLLHGYKYSGGARVTVSAPSDSGGAQAQVSALMGDDYAEVEVTEFRDSDDPTTPVLNIDDRGRIQTATITHQGGGYTDGSDIEAAPTISIHAPTSQRPVIVASPYVQNCSNVSGPWDNTGQRISERTPLPFDVNDVYNDGKTNPARRTVDPWGSGGGIRVDGACPASYSPLRSFVVDAFTQVNQGGIGFLLTNLAYAQFVSTFGTFCTVHMMAVGGSFANASNSVTDFGIRGLLARGAYRFPYLRSKVVAPTNANAITEFGFVANRGYRSKLRSIKLVKGSGYDVPPFIAIDPPDDNGLPGTLQAQATAQISQTSAVPGTLTNLVMTSKGAGYKRVPQVTFSPPPGYSVDDGTKVLGAATVELEGIQKVRVQITDASQRPNNNKPDVLSVARVNGSYYVVQGSAVATDDDDLPIPDTFDILFGGEVGSPDYADLDKEIQFFKVSSISTGGHVFEYVGGPDARAITYNALPEYGGIPDANQQIVMQGQGKIYYTSSDHEGNQRIGKYFVVEQATGKVSINTSAFDLSGLESIQFRRNKVLVGVPLKEVSDNAGLVSSLGQPDTSTVPTQTAVMKYVSARAVPLNGTSGNFLRWRSDADGGGYAWGQADFQTLGIVDVTLRTDVISGLVADGDAKVYGNVTCDTIVTTKGAQIHVPTVAAPENAGDMTFELTGNDTLTIKVMGSDGIVRKAALDLV